MMMLKEKWLFEPVFESSFFPDFESEEYFRQYNQKFRGEMLETIARSENHPLRFLIEKINGQWRWKRAKDRRVDAGHVTPVMMLKKRGYKTERLAVQDMSMNRRAGAIMRNTGKSKRIKVLNIAGVPIDQDTVRKYIGLKMLPKKFLNSPVHKGWTNKELQELFFALGESHDWAAYFK
jgi:hypothetical protein